MADSFQATAGLARSIENGRVFARFQFDSKGLDPLIEGLNYASTQEAIANVTQLRAIGKQVLEAVKRGFPDGSKSKSPQSRVVSSLGLRDGWRVRFYDAVAVNALSDGGPSLLGFVIEHRMASNKRIRTILSSLESGSKPYTIRPVHKKALAFPGLGGDMIMRAKADIPARAGLGYLRKAQIFADQLVASRGSTMERELVELIEKGKRYKARALSADSFDAPATPAIAEAVERYAPSHPRQMLRAGKLLKRRVASRMFAKDYR